MRQSKIRHDVVIFNVLIYIYIFVPLNVTKRLKFATDWFIEYKLITSNSYMYLLLSSFVFEFIIIVRHNRFNFHLMAIVILNCKLIRLNKKWKGNEVSLQTFNAQCVLVYWFNCQLIVMIMMKLLRIAGDHTIRTITTGTHKMRPHILWSDSHLQFDSGHLFSHRRSLYEPNLVFESLELPNGKCMRLQFEIMDAVKKWRNDKMSICVAFLR